MYYHCRELKYVTYGKVFPAPVERLNLTGAYRWLAKYCGFFPQVWLSRSLSKITGAHNQSENILFGFENIQGFPVRYDHWCFLLGQLCEDTSKTSITAYFSEMTRDMKSESEELDDVLKDWEKSNGLEDYLQRFLFVERDQVVVPSLNLKAAKTIICRNEKQKKTLRKMGFIDDRIEIKNVKIW